MPRLFTVEGLATETGHDRRTIGRMMRGVPPDGKAAGRDAWHLRTALDALLDRQGGQRDPDTAEIERLVQVLDRGLARAREIEDTEERRELLREIGPLCGKLDRLLSSLDDSDIVLELLHREIMVDTVSDFVELYRALPVAASDLNIRWSGDDA